jgi:exodeoxyribonuclease V beta subunit
LLYSVAVHRFLRRRIAGYDPAVHLGGIGYLYVRGMIGPATPVVDGVPYGVFAWRPPASTIVALDALFATGVAP